MRAPVLLGVTLVLVLSLVVVLIGFRRSGDVPAGINGKIVDHGTTNVRDGSRITVVLGKRSFSPTFLRGAAGTRFVVHLQAEGFHAHSFTVPALGIDVTVPPGGVADVPITIPAAPTSVFYCRFHRREGMQGGLIRRGD